MSANHAKVYSVNRIEIAIKVLIEFAAALRAFAAKLLQRRLEPSLLDSQRTKSPLVDVQRQLEPSLLDFQETEQVEERYLPSTRSDPVGSETNGVYGASTVAFVGLCCISIYQIRF